MKLTPTQEAMLKLAPVEWGPLPDRVSIMNSTLRSLRMRRLVELRQPNQLRRPYYWEWRRTPDELEKVAA